MKSKLTAGTVLPLVLCAGACGAIAVFRLMRNNTGAMDWWLAHVSMPWKRWASALVDRLPFSAAEVCCTLAILAALAAAAVTVWQLLHGQAVCWVGRLLGLCAAGLWIYAAVCAFWGTQYYGTDFQEKIGLQAQPVTAQELQKVTIWFRDKVNETAGDVPRNESGLFAVSVQEILQLSQGLYRGIEQEYPCLQGPERTVKKAFYSKLMSLAGFTGYLFPLAGETTVNVDCPAVLIPATVAHEISHQRGVAPEQEANFCAVRAAELSGDAVYAYSGWLFGYIHLYNALLQADPQAAIEAAEGLCPEARMDLDDNTEYWNRFSGPIKTVMQGNYSAFIRGYGQQLGMASYGACVDLLVACYGARAEE